MALCPGLLEWASTRKVKPIWILLKQDTVTGSDISWAICKSAPRSRQITTLAPHHSVFYRPDALPAAQPTVSKHWRPMTKADIAIRIKALKFYKIWNSYFVAHTVIFRYHSSNCPVAVIMAIVTDVNTVVCLMIVPSTVRLSLPMEGLPTATYNSCAPRGPAHTHTHKHTHTHTHTHTHMFNGPLSGTTQVSRYQKGKTNLDFTEARDSEWQWHPLGHMQVCTSLQSDNHASTQPLSFYRPDALPAAQPTVSKHWRQPSILAILTYKTLKAPVQQL